MEDGFHLFCQRTTSDWISQNGRPIHRLTGDEAAAFQDLLDKLPQRPVPHHNLQSELAKQAILFFRLGTDHRENLAQQLGVSAESLRRLGVGFTHAFDRHDRTGAFTAPELDGEGEIIGIHIRKPNGTKFQAGHSRRGLVYEPRIIAAGLGPILAVEGLSDTAALLTMGIRGIGRPSNLGGVDHLIDLLDSIPLENEIIVIGERDQKPDGRWPGREGAISTALQLAEALQRPIAWSLPPDNAKDTRAWLNSAPQGLSAERLANLFLSGLSKTWVHPLPRLKVQEPPGPVVDLVDWRSSMLDVRLASLATPGCYLDRSPTGSGKTNVDLRVLLHPFSFQEAI